MTKIAISAHENNRFILTNTLTALRLTALAIVAFFNLPAQPSPQWARAFGDSHNRSTSVAVDRAGNIYTTGFFIGTTDFDPGIGTYTLSSVSSAEDIYISKLDVAGNLLWAKSLGSAGTDIGNCLAVDTVGNLYVACYYNGVIDTDPGPATFTLNSLVSGRGFILKLDPAGNFIFAKATGGDPKSIALDKAGGIYATGWYSGTFDFDPSANTFTMAAVANQDIYVSKLNALGDFVWAKSIGGSGVDVAYGIAVDLNENVYVTGTFSGVSDFDPGTATYAVTSSGGNDMFVFKLSSAGNFVWAKAVGMGLTQDSGTAIKVDGAGNVYVIGAAYNGLLIKMSSTGTIIYNKKISVSIPLTLAIDSAGDIYVAGSFNGPGDFDPGTATYTINSSGDFDAFVAKFNPSGTFINAYPIGGAGEDQCTGLVFDASGGMIITGYFSDVVDFDPTTDTLHLTTFPLTIQNSFIVKFGGSLSTGLKEDKLAGQVLIYPNPFADRIIFELKNTDQNIRIEFYDSIGKIAGKTTDGVGKIIVQRTDLEKGIYFYKLFADKTLVGSGKIIAE